MVNRAGVSQCRLAASQSRLLVGWRGQCLLFAVAAGQYNGGQSSLLLVLKFVSSKGSMDCAEQCLPMNEIAGI